MFRLVEILCMKCAWPRKTLCGPLIPKAVSRLRPASPAWRVFPKAKRLKTGRVFSGGLEAAQRVN
jgi:hypothetical protein